MLTISIIGTDNVRLPEHIDPKTNARIVEVEDKKQGFIRVTLDHQSLPDKTFYGGSVLVDGQSVRQLLAAPQRGSISRFDIGMPGQQAGMVAMKFCTKESGTVQMQGSTQATDEGMPSLGGLITVRFYKVKVKVKSCLVQSSGASIAFNPRAEVGVGEKKSDGMHVEIGDTQIPNHPSPLTITKWGEEVCSANVFYASDFQLTVAQVKKSGVAASRHETWREGPLTAARRQKRKMAAGSEGSPIEL